MATERIVIQVEARGFKTVRRDIRNVQKTAKSAATILQTLRNVLVVVAAVRVIRRLTDLADSFVNLRNRLQATLGSFEAAVEAQNEIIRISRETRTSVDATGDAFARLALGAKDLGLSTQTLLAVTTTLNKAIILSGATAQEARNAMIQLSQGIAAGALRGDELRAVLEQLPLVARIIADEFDVPLGQLRKLGEQGKLTTERIIKAFQGAAEKIDKDFGNTVVTIDQALSVLGGNFTVFIDELFNASGASQGVAGAIQSLSDTLQFLTDNLFLVNGLLAVLATLLAIKVIALAFAGAMVVVTSAVIATAGATGVLNIALLALRGALISVGLAFLATPFGAVVLAIAFAVGAYVALDSIIETTSEQLEKQTKILASNRQELDDETEVTRKAADAKIAFLQATQKSNLALLEERKLRLEATSAENDPLGEFGFIGETDKRLREFEEIESKIAEIRKQLQQYEARARDSEAALRLLAEAQKDAFSADQLETLEDLEFELSQFGRSAREAAVAALLFAEKDDIASDKTGRFKDELIRLGGAIFDAEEALDRAADAQKVRDKATEERIDLINELKSALKTTGEIEEEIGGKLLEVRGALIKAGFELAEVDALLAREKKDLVDAQRDELFPELIEFLDDQKTLRDQLNDVQVDAVEIKRQAIQDGMSEAAAIALTNTFIAEQNKLLIENSEARQLADSFFTADKAARDFADAQEELNTNGEAAGLTLEQQNELLRAYLRETAGASNAALEFEQAQQKLNLALAKGAVSLEEAEEITRRNRIELLESQRTLEAGAERSFLKFIDDATNAAAQTERLMTDVFNNLEDALFEFVKTGKLSFNSLVQTIVDGLIKIGIQQAIGAAFAGGSSLFGGAGVTGSGAAGGSAGGIGGLIAGGLFGAHNGAQFTVGANNAAASLPGIDNRLIAFKARDGEDVTVTPRGGGGGMAPINIVQNIQTRDADSFKRSEGQLAARAMSTLQRANARR